MYACHIRQPDNFRLRSEFFGVFLDAAGLATQGLRSRANGMMFPVSWISPLFGVVQPELWRWILESRVVAHMSASVVNETPSGEA